MAIKEDPQICETAIHAGGQVWLAGLVLRWRHKDGSYRYLGNAVLVLNDSGEVVGYRGADNHPA